jgi:hypothetical protein
MGRAFVERRPVQIADVLDDTDYDPRSREALQRGLGYRTFLGVPFFEKESLSELSDADAARSDRLPPGK